MSGKSIVAIDPGGTSGIAVRFPDDKWMTCTAKTPGELWDLITPAVDAVAIEPFAPFNKAGRISQFGLYTVRLVGGVQALCNRYSIPLVEQPPAKRKPFILKAENMLKALARPYVVHEVDALSHLLTYERYNGR